MDDQHAEFLREIIADPERDLPRLVYADWLVENGEPERAEFIRVQCELALQEQAVDRLAAGHPGDDITDRAERKADRLRRRERDLLSRAPGRWRDSQESQRAWGVLGLWSVVDITWEWRRGFIDEITATWLQASRHLPAIREATPLRRVVVDMIPLLSCRWVVTDNGVNYLEVWIIPNSKIVRADSWPQPFGDEYMKLRGRVLAAEFGSGLEWQLPDAAPRLDIRYDAVTA